MGRTGWLSYTHINSNHTYSPQWIPLTNQICSHPSASPRPPIFVKKKRIPFANAYGKAAETRRRRAAGGGRREDGTKEQEEVAGDENA